MQNNYCIKIVKLHPLPPLLWNKTKPEKPSKHWANEPAQLARKTISAFAFPAPVQGRTGCAGIWGPEEARAGWSQEAVQQRLMTYASLTASHAAGPSAANHREENPVRQYVGRALSSVRVCSTHTSIQATFSIAVCLFFFPLKMELRHGIQSDGEPRWMRKVGVTSSTVACPTFTWIGHH